MEVSVRDLRVVRGGRTVLEVPELCFPSGTATAVFGPNGAGKTTLLRTIAGLEHPARGRVLIDGVAPSERPRAAFAFQSAVFLRGTVRENLELGLVLRRMPESARHARLDAAARECGVVALLDRPAHQLSGGEAQRVNLARALALGAPVTLLDEPLAGVDRAARAQLLADLPMLLQRLAATAVIVTHDRDEAFRLADRLVVLAAGRLLATGTKRELYAAPPDPETAALLGYTVLPLADGMIGVPAGALVLGGAHPESRSVAVRVERLIDMGREIRILGRIETTRVELPLAPGAVPPAPGETIQAAILRSVPIIFQLAPTEQRRPDERHAQHSSSDQ